MRSRGRSTLAVMCAVLMAVLAGRVSFAQQAARIDTVSPTQAASGEVVTITGIGFGARNVQITVGGVPAKVISATGTRVTFVVPYGVPPGPTVITATQPGGHQGTIAFFIVGVVNKPPAVHAGTDSRITFPNSVALNGVVTDDGLPFGSTLSIQWTQLSGPGIVTFASPNSAVTTASFSLPGSYDLRLTANDTEYTVFDETTITVDPPNAPPVVNAGPDLTVTLPNSATLNGS